MSAAPDDLSGPDRALFAMTERDRLADALEMDPAAPMPLPTVRLRAAARGVDLSTFACPVAVNALGGPGHKAPLAIAPPAFPREQPAPPPAFAPLTPEAEAALRRDGARFRWYEASRAKAEAEAQARLAYPDDPARWRAPTELCEAAARAMDLYCQTLSPPPGRARRVGHKA